MNKAAEAARDAALAEGKTAEFADNLQAEVKESETRRMKEEKARKNEERKKQAAKNSSKVGASKAPTSFAEGQNGAYFAALTAAQDTVLNHPVFKGIIAEEPLPIRELLESGVQAVWVEADCERTTAQQLTPRGRLS